MLYRVATLGDFASEHGAQVQTVTAGAGATAAALAPAAAVPIIGAAVVAVGVALALIFGRKGPQQRVASTAIVNDLEPLLRENLEAYLSGPRTRSSQAAALANFDQAWAYLISEQACGADSLGNPGKACISDRQAGASTWRDANGQPWNWFIGYRDPIANDPTVQPDPTDQFAAAFTGQAGGSSGVWMLAAAGLIIGGLFL